MITTVTIVSMMVIMGILLLARRSLQITESVIEGDEYAQWIFVGFVEASVAGTITPVDVDQTLQPVIERDAFGDSKHDVQCWEVFEWESLVSTPDHIAATNTVVRAQLRTQVDDTPPVAMVAPLSDGVIWEKTIEFSDLQTAAGATSYQRENRVENVSAGKDGAGRGRLLLGAHFDLMIDGVDNVNKESVSLRMFARRIVVSATEALFEMLGIGTPAFSML